MLIARGTDDEGGNLIILGLSHENIRRLLEGKPINCKRKTHGDGIPEGWQISICVGETEESLADDFRRIGIINQKTAIYGDERLGKEGT